MKILFLSPRQCWPVITGARLREFHFLRALGERADVSYAFFREPGSDSPGKAELPFCVDVVGVARPAMYTAGKIVRGLTGRRPLPIENYASGEMSAVVRQLSASKTFHLAHLDSIHMVNYEECLDPSVPVVYNWHNIESEAMERFGRNSPSLLKQWYSAITAKGLVRAENEILNRALGHLVCSERERQHLLTDHPLANIAVVENGVDTDFFAEPPHLDPAPVRNRIVFVGSMNYHANADAAAHFSREIWPEIHRRHPQWTLTIVGSSPGPAVLALRQLAGVEVTGTVPDVRPYYREALASIVPLKVGGGTRLKILEAMSSGVPVVSSTLGAEGLAVASGDNILLADTAETWLPALESLNDRGLRLRLTESARRLVMERYDWRIAGKILFETYNSWLTIPAAKGPC